MHLHDRVREVPARASRHATPLSMTVRAIAGSAIDLYES
ncbi:hypothetical protein EV148_104137 [Dokdonella fugitiva]|jgi:hypothetical protein|uniref:Uncharacterized protein n=1 Tax=Dokdonella fugitiva TaxID=328517 RepID=A0A4R2I9S4_9GAMM|nr:hypothetical protein EV148_104137 [Dokdonella fugitiva]